MHSLLFGTASLSRYAALCGVIETSGGLSSYLFKKKKKKEKGPAGRGRGRGDCGIACRPPVPGRQRGPLRRNLPVGQKENEGAEARC